MSSNIALVIAGIALATLIYVMAALWISSRRLFKAVIALHPELGELGRFPFFGQYGPLPPAQMAYLQDRRFNQLQDPALRALGLRSLRLYYAYAITFVAMLLSPLSWSLLRGVA
jgi:hypothetical protein